MKFVMFYDVAEKRSFPKLLRTFRLMWRGYMNLIHAAHASYGRPVGYPPEGALGIFTTRKAAEEFISGDPFVINGVVEKWRIVEWNEVLA